MTADRRALLRRRLAASGLEGSAGDTRIPRRCRRDRARLSPAQKHAWRYQRAHPGSLSNNLGILFEFTGEIDEQGLARAVERLAERHEILRTTYGADADGTPFQRIHDTLPFSASFGRVEPEEAVERAEAALRIPFDLGIDAPLRLLIFRTGPDRVAMALVVHHILWDGATFDVLCRDLERVYADPSGTLPALPLQYGDVADWYADRQATSADLGYWTGRLADPRPTPSLRPSGGDISSPAEAAGRIDRRLAASAALGRVASQHRVTPFVAFIACWAAVLGAGGAREVSLGTTVLVRDEPGTGPLIGNLANHVVLRLSTAGTATAAALMAAATAEFDAAYTHRALPYEDMVDALGGQAIDSPPGFFDTLVVFIPGGTEGPRLPGATTTWRRLHNGATQFPLVPLGLEVFVRGRGAEAIVDVEATYARAAFDEQAIDRLLVSLDDAILGASRNAW